ncbi:hypothetical protein ScalyP_jg761 [Parmales sp. scaly parma]|nr:hypothetical protein ScalyP_jg761 [Parmales sp. scaly parma]
MMSIAHVEGDSDGYMKCVVNVDASVEECAAYCFTLLSRKRRRINDRKNVLDKSVAATKITQVSETECKIEMIFDPIPKKNKYRTRKIAVSDCSSRMLQF